VQDGLLSKLAAYRVPPAALEIGQLVATIDSSPDARSET
jgi:hypothetical protein